eukprot:symbB.v1.2.006242.t1/scaffold370.1/size393101/8
MAWWQPAVGSAAMAASLVVWQVKQREWAESHTWQTAVQQYLLYAPMKSLGELRRRQVLWDASRAERVQKDLLKELLKRHQETEYGRARGLQSVDSWESYCRVQPITQYSDYEVYFQRIRQGHRNVLNPGALPRLAMTSATQGEPKFLPDVTDLGKTFYRRGGLVALAILEHHFPEATRCLHKTLKLAFRAPTLILESGVEVGCKRAPNSPNFDRLLCAYSSPKAAYDVMHEPDALYAHALFAVKDRDLGILEANFAPNICDFLDFVRDHYESLAADLEQGRPWSTKASEHPVEPETMAALQKALGHSPQRAEELREICEGSTFCAHQLWAKLHLVVTVTGGNFEASTRRLKRLLGDVPIYSPFYAATEGLLGVNIYPDQERSPCYLLDPGSMVMELLPLQWSNLSTSEIPLDAPIPAWAGHVGEAYELLVTTRGGLCRYRLGDVVRLVSQQEGQMPLVQLQGRVGKTLTLCGEDLPEFHFVRALAQSPVASKVRGAIVVETPLAAATPEQLQICIEEDLGQSVGMIDLHALDAALMDQAASYARLRRRST